jgi:hypothetical protein
MARRRVDHVFDYFGRRSMIRRALPTDRSSFIGGASCTSQDTPM